jgi:outer membrane receptor protein involved in Fe transport
MKACLMASTLFGGLSLAAPAMAQDEAADDTIVVTGTRIQGTSLASFAPVTSVGQADIQASGKISIGEMLLELPGQGSGLSRNYNNGGDGSVRLDFRSLGSGRTLILVNGRRWVNSGEGANSSVDLNSIPSAAVERVEILRDGASAIYGSDAIAGVVNIIMKDDYEGLEFTHQIGEYFDGGGMATSSTVTFGTTSDNASIMGGLSYVNISALSNADRAQTAARPSFGGSSGTPQGRFAYGGVVPGCSNFQPSEGTAGTAPGDFRCWESPEDRFNYNPYNYVETPSERYNAFLRATYDISDTQSFHVDMSYQNRQSEQLLAPMPLFYGFGDFGGQEGIAASNPFNPFGLEFCGFDGLTVDGRTCDDATLGAGNYAVGWFGRRMLEAGNRLFQQDITTYIARLGFDGEFAGWNYSVYYSYGQNESVTTTEGLLNTGNIRRALSGDDCTGDCVHLNIFGGQGADSAYLGDGLWSGSGSITQEMIDYITFTAHDTGGNTMIDYGFDISGQLFDLPAGPVGMAFGYENRQERGFFSPDAFIAAGLSSGNAADPVSGGFTLDEAYVEFQIPILENLEANLASRYSDYDTFGTTSNSKLALLWQATEDLTIRGSVAQGFRAPPIATLFGGTGDSFPDLQDPCDVNAANFTGSGTTQAGVCAAQGVPDGFTQPNSQIRITVGGNPNAQPEESESYTFGAVFSPSAIEGLSLYLDYYNIEITDTLSSIGAQIILDGCYTGSNPAYCSLITRGASGLISDLVNTTTNIGSVETSGWEFAATYDFDNDWGLWRLSFDGRLLDNYDVTQSNGDVQQRAGFVLGSARDNYTDFKFNAGVSWARDIWFGSATIQHFAAADGVANTPTTVLAGGGTNVDSIRELDATTYVDLQAGVDLERFNSRIAVGIDNIFDQDPPFFPESFANDFDPAYRTWGSRSWYARVTTTF